MQKIVVVILTLAAVSFLTGCGVSKPAPKHDLPRVSQGVTVDGMDVSNLTEQELRAVLNKAAVEKYEAPVDAGFDETGMVFEGRNGRMINVGAMLEQVMLAPPNSHMQSIYQEVLPAVTIEKLKTARKIGSYATKILDDTPERMHNIKLTANLINNQIIGAGKEFSFNRATGEPTVERGFKAAAIFADGGRHEQGIGGGMCQVSSTLYNAVLKANLLVTERHPHSQPVSYVPAGYDATIYTDKDFKFVNNTRRTIIIRAFVAGKILTIDLFALL